MSKPFNNAIHISKKYTQGSTGIFERLRRLFAVDPERSTGIPIKHFRNPAPGGQDPNAYDDPVTIPAADIADNPYWKRDMRRSYPTSSHITQGKAVGLLSMGSAASPSAKLLAGEAGAKQLVSVQQDGDSKGLSVFFEGEGKTSVSQVLAEGGLPPMPVQTRAPKGEKAVGSRKYEVREEQSYAGQYPVRNFV